MSEALPACSLEGTVPIFVDKEQLDKRIPAGLGMGCYINNWHASSDSRINYWIACTKKKYSTHKRLPSHHPLSFLISSATSPIISISFHPSVSHQAPNHPFISYLFFTHLTALPLDIRDIEFNKLVFIPRRDKPGEITHRQHRLSYHPSYPSPRIVTRTKHGHILASKGSATALNLPISSPTLRLNLNQGFVEHKLI